MSVISFVPLIFKNYIPESNVHWQGENTIKYSDILLSTLLRGKIGISTTVVEFILLLT